MAKKKRKDIPFHIAHNYKHFELGGSGIKFWAKDESDAKLYCDKIGWSLTLPLMPSSPLPIEEITEK